MAWRAHPWISWRLRLVDRSSALPSIEFRFFKGKEELAEVSCGLLKEVQPGTTARIECSGDQPLPQEWDNLTVQNSI